MTQGTTTTKRSRMLRLWSIVSSVILVVVLVGWIRSYFVADSIGWRTSHGVSNGILYSEKVLLAEKGGLAYQVWNGKADLDEKDITKHLQSFPDISKVLRIERTSELRYPGPDDRDILGFRYGYKEGETMRDGLFQNYSLRILVCPCWFLSCVLAITTGLLLRKLFSKLSVYDTDVKPLEQESACDADKPRA